MNDNEPLPAAMRTPILDWFGMRHPVFAFSHSVPVVAQVSRHGGLGVYGATRRTPEARNSAAASSIVRSRGVEVIALAGLYPPVPERPGRTITRLVPKEENWPTT